MNGEFCYCKREDGASCYVDMDIVGYPKSSSV